METNLKKLVNDYEYSINDDCNWFVCYKCNKQWKMYFTAITKGDYNNNIPFDLSQYDFGAMDIIMSIDSKAICVNSRVMGFRYENTDYIVEKINHFYETGMFTLTDFVKNHTY